MSAKMTNLFGSTMINCFLLAIIMHVYVQMSAGDVTATLYYHVNDGNRPFFYGYQREGKQKGELDRGGTRKAKEVVIHNGRIHKELSLDVHSFELENCPTSLSTADFYEEDQQKIKEIYYKEMKECLRRKLGAERVIIFNHLLRNEKKKKGSGYNGNTSIQGYADTVHSDTTPEAANFLWAYSFYRFAPDLEMRFYEGRYLYINLWRNIDDDAPIGKDPLAVLDQTSMTEGVGSEDYMEADVHTIDSGRKNCFKQYVLNEKNSGKHRWYYFPNMTKDEAILFKQWDSDPQKLGRMCFHTSFVDATSSLVEAPTRQSIETRFIAYFPDHRPNTCPGRWLIYEVKIMMNFDGIMIGLKTMAAVGSIIMLWKWWKRKPSLELNKED